MSPEVPYFYYEAVFAITAFVLGAVVGSFLNVCIYRLPLNMSVNEPKRSFCPNCKAQIAWYHNLPIISWLWLRGRCASCHKPIAVRYPLVELLTAALFLLIWWTFREQWHLLLPYWVFVSLLIVATFIDFDHFIIPDEITLGGTMVGVLFCLSVPTLMHEDSHATSLFWSIVSAAIGYGLLRGVVELGKLAFGKKRVVLPEPEDFTWTRKGDDAELVIAGETDLWSEFFNREKDQLILQCDQLNLAGHHHENATLQCFYNRVVLGGTTHRLEKLDSFSGRLREFVFPREAMGLGDVKYIACIGAFLGWRAVLFTVAAGSMVGSIVGVGLLALGPKARSLKIPFGPYLSVGALLWLFVGPEILKWYLHLVRP